MKLKDILLVDSSSSSYFDAVQEEQRKIASGRAQRVNYYWYVGSSLFYAIECYLQGDPKVSKEAARTVVDAALAYFYGKWRNTLKTPDGKVGVEEWKPHCLWYEEVMRSLPWACALGDWDAVRKIAAYPPENKLPETAKAKGETAWGWALITFLRGQPRERVEHFLVKAETDNAKRPKLLCPVLRALLDSDAAQFEKTLLAYLAYFRKSEFKRVIDKVVALDGTTLYHLGRRQGFQVTLPESVAAHIIQLPK